MSRVFCPRLKDIFLKLLFNILKYYMIFFMIYLFCQKEWKFKTLKNLYSTCIIKKNVIKIRNLKQAFLKQKFKIRFLNQGLIFNKLYRIIKCSQDAWLKPYNDLTKLTKIRWIVQRKSYVFFLKQTQPRIRVNQHISMSVELKQNRERENKKTTRRQNNRNWWHNN